MAQQEYKTGGRARIMAYLKAAGDRPVSVSDIRNHMEAIKAPVNVTTIYRYLEKLEADGNIIKYAAGEDGKITYQYAEKSHGCDRHLHLKCVECGGVKHLDCRFMDEIANHIERNHGFALQCRNSVIYGLCSTCQHRLNWGRRFTRNTKIRLKFN